MKEVEHMDIEQRLETPADYAETEKVVREAFWNVYAPGCTEHYLVHVMRSSENFVRELAFVAVADSKIVGCVMFVKGFALRYYNSKRLGEVDFVIQNGRDITPIEIKFGKDYKKHCALSNVLAVDEWNLKRAIVFCRGNIERDKAVTYLPWYMVPFVVPEEAASGKMPVIDLSALSDAIKV